MTSNTWKQILQLLDDDEQRRVALEPTKPVKVFERWYETAHGTLGHLTACQAAWIPMLHLIRDGATKGSIPIRPDPLYTKLGFGDAKWSAILQQFVADRSEWRKILKGIDLAHQIKTPTSMLTAQSLTKRLVAHEKRHLDELLSRSGRGQ